MITPRIVPLVSLTGLLGILLCGVLAWQVQHVDDAQRQRDCERAVAVREDNRAMWLYLVDTAPEPTDAAGRARTVAFVRELNTRLPSLECRDGMAVPEKP